MFTDPMKKIERCKAKNNGEKLASLGEHKKKDVRLAAIDAMGCIGKNEEAYNALVTSVHDADAEIRAHAIESLGKMGDLKARAHIEHQSKIEKNQEVLSSIAKALQMLHGKNDD